MNTIEIVNASAGSGKTHDLTHRALKAIENGLPAEKLFAATFTRKAAADLEKRLRLLLLSAGQADAAECVPDGFIGTVHSACARLLSEYAIDAGLSPAIDIIPEDNSDTLFQRAVAGAIEFHGRELEKCAKRLCRRGGGGGIFAAHQDWRDDVRKIAELARTNHISPDALRRCGEDSWNSFRDMLGKPGRHIDNASLFREIGKAISLLEAMPELSKGSRGALETLREIARRETYGELPWNEWAKLAKLKTPKDGAAAMADLNDLAAKWLRCPLFHADMRDMIAGVFTCAADGMSSYDDYKHARGLIDFADQEARTLYLLETSEVFRASLRERLALLMVDEFQDTSPMQLAVFLELNRLLGHSVWVGDPKQAIYGFRGADPVLMASVVGKAEKTSTLNHSWRSRENLVKFSNAVFTQAFHALPEKLVRLDVPKERAKEAKGGDIEAWLLGGGNKDAAAAGLAKAVVELLRRQPELKPADIAILCRTNPECDSLAAGLGALGLRASTAEGMLATAPVCRLALAALRYMLDNRDTLAAAELVKYSPSHPGRDSWLQDLMTDPKAAFATWKSAPVFQRLDSVRGDLRHWTPLEALEYAIAASEAPLAAKLLPNSGLALANLDKLRAACAGYLDQCRARRGAASGAGFIAFLQSNDPGQAEGNDEQAVRVLTYHKAKGLEWPVVVLYSLDAGNRGGAFGVAVETDAAFDPARPLAGRRIRFWPDPLPGNQKSAELDALLSARPEQAIAVLRETEERRRLLYVGFTRARDRLVLAVRKSVTKTAGTKLLTSWLDELADKNGKPLLNPPTANDAGKMQQTHTLSVGGDKFSVAVHEYPETLAVKPVTTAEPPVFIAPPQTGIAAPVPARLSPSSLPAATGPQDTFGVEVVADFKTKIAVKGKPDYAHLGDAVHGFLGMDCHKRDKEDMLRLAGGLLERFGVADAVSIADLMAIRDRLDQFIAGRYPDCRVFREWPVTYRNEQNQLMQGWIDMLLETDSGFVIIDHKTYPGKDVAERVKQYAPQLFAYRQAVEAATGKKVFSLLLHLPVLEIVTQII